MVSDSNFIIVGKIGSPYGVRGWVKVHSFTHPFDNIMNYKPLYLKKGKEWQPIPVEAMRHHGKGLVAQLGDCHDRNAAQLLTNSELAVERSQLPTLDEGDYYWKDLVGLTVINQNGKILGQVDHIIETGANDVLVIKKEGLPDVLIPYLPEEVITDINLPEQKIHVDWHEDENES